MDLSELNSRSKETGLKREHRGNQLTAVLVFGMVLTTIWWFDWRVLLTAFAVAIFRIWWVGYHEEAHTLAELSRELRDVKIQRLELKCELDDIKRSYSRDIEEELNRTEED